MQIFENIGVLKNLMFFTAPASHSPQPYTIAPKIQLVELITDGVVYFEIDNIKRPCRRGTIFWHIAGDSTVYETTSEAPYQCLVLAFQVPQDKRYAPRVSFWRSSDAALEEFTQSVHYSFSNLNDNDDALAILSTACAAELLTHALKLKPLHANAPVPLSDAPEYLMLRNAMNFMEKNLARPITVNSAAEALKIPRNKLFKLFQEQLKLTPHQWLLEKRLQHARSLLERSNSSLKEIAGACGFEHQEVFHRNFKWRFNQTPKQYRQTNAQYQDLLS